MKVNVITMGCSKNLVDSEHLLKQIESGGFEVFHDSEKPSDIVIINTCGFILDAKEESIGMIMKYINAKEKGLIKKLYVMGCLSARYKNELALEIPEVDHFFGKFDLDDIINELGIQKRKDLLFDRHLTTPSHFAYLKIAEGCDRSCSFCAIPNFTGGYKSVPIEYLIEEATKLAQRGVKELLLIAQELSYYGIDLYKERKLDSLIDLLSKIEGIEWIRLHYAYPAKFPVEILKIMRENRKVCKYLDIPFQHISDNVLSRMRRNITGKQTRELINLIRNEVPGIAIRTTLLVGFPGETNEDFIELVDFVKEIKFDRMGVFPYSHEDDTYAAINFIDDVPQEVKQQRADYLMEIQQGIQNELNSKKVGSVLRTIIDRKEGNFFIGRTECDSPEVDGEVLINLVPQLSVGEFYDIKISSNDYFDLYGEVSF